MLTRRQQSFTRIPVSSLLPGTSSLLLSQPSRKSKSAPYIPLRIGDFNNDGYPDILATIVNSTAAPPVGGIFGGPRSTGAQISLMQNVACGKKDQVEGGACDGGKLGAKRRKLSVVSDTVTNALANIWDARGAAWFDIDEDVGRSFLSSLLMHLILISFATRELWISRSSDLENKMAKR